MDGHEKNAILISAGLPGALHGLLHCLLFVHAPPGSGEATVAMHAIGGGTEKTIARRLEKLAALHHIEIIKNGRKWCGDRPVQRPHTYRVLTVAERYARQQAEAAEVEILTVTIDGKNDRLDSPADLDLPSSCTTPPRAREAEAARAFWLPTLPRQPSQDCSSNKGEAAMTEQNDQPVAASRQESATGIAQGPSNRYLGAGMTRGFDTTRHPYPTTEFCFGDGHRIMDIARADIQGQAL